jgi:hypothetical protein
MHILRASHKIQGRRSVTDSLSIRKTDHGVVERTTWSHSVTDSLSITSPIMSITHGRRTFYKRQNDGSLAR